MKSLFKTYKKNCKSWKITIPKVYEDNCIEDFSERLAKEAIGMMIIHDKCIASSKIAHLKRIWNITTSCTVKTNGIPNLQPSWTSMLAHIKNLNKTIRDGGISP